MVIDNPKVTLEDMIRTTLPDGNEGMFADWMTQFVFHGDDGELYSVALTLMSMRGMGMDVFVAQAAKGHCRLEPVAGTIYKRGIHPALFFDRTSREMGENCSTIAVKEDRAVLTLSDYYTLELFPDGAWHYMYDSGDGSLKADFTQRPVGYPLWYGRQTPAIFTQHCIQYGYVWSGDTEGSLFIDGKEVKVKGRGIHERAVSQDNSTAEVGAGENWGQFSFDELHTEFWEMLLSGNRDLHIYDIETGRNYMEGTLEIVPDDWAYVLAYDGFLPHTYHIRQEVEDGVLEITAKVGNAIFWEATGQRPENPCATPVFEDVTGTFTMADGTVRTLTNGAGSMSVRQWRAYPNLFPKELFLEAESLGGEKYDYF